MLSVFGPGSLFIQRTDIATQTPVNIGFINEFSLDFAFNKKELYGQNQFPLFIARGTGKCTGKAKPALVSAIALNSVFFGQTFVAGSVVTVVSETHTVPSSGPYTIGPVNASTFVDNLTVVYGANGLPLILASGTPNATGSYTAPPAANGSYTFNSGDAGKSVNLTYTYTNAAVGQQFTFINEPLGYTPTWQFWYWTSWNGVPLQIKVYQCISDKVGMAFKLEDFMMPETDFSIFANAAGNLAEMSFGEVS